MSDELSPEEFALALMVTAKGGGRAGDARVALNDHDNTQRAKLAAQAERIEKLRAACEALMKAAPAFRAKPEGAPNSMARARQNAHIAAEDDARAALTENKP